MSKTLRSSYTKIVKGRMSANKGFLKALNGNFTMPGSVPVETMSTVIAEMWDTFTTGALSAGTLTSDTSNNLLVTLTVTNRYTSIKKSATEKNAMEYDPDAMLEANEQGADALLKVVQGNVIAAAIAATPGLSVALGAGATGWVDGIIPASATYPDVINCIVAPVGRLFERVRSRNGGTNEGMVAVADETFLARLKALANFNYAPGQLRIDPNGDAYWDGVRIWGLSGETNFGGASNACMYVIGGHGFALNWNDPLVYWETASGWGQPGDGYWEYQLQLPHAYGLVNSQFLGELTSPAS